MTGPGRIIAAVRPATFVAGGAFAVHELTYLAGFGAGTSHAPQEHSYLAALLPALAVLVALTLIATVERGVAAAPARRASWLSRVVTYTAAILALFLAQETAEALLAGGDPAQLGAMLAPDVLVAAPLALGFGSLAWLAARALEAVEARIATRFERSEAPDAARSGLRPRWLDIVLSPAVLPGGAAPRAPPASI